MGVAKLMLGTASFGGHVRRNIGASGVPSREESIAILARASDLGLGVDTAAAYGYAEQLVSEFVWCGPVTTKLLPLLSCSPGLIETLITREVEASCLVMNAERVGVMFHTPTHGADPYYVEALRGQPACDEIGTSVYTPTELAALVPGQTIVQFPYHVLDRRFEHVTFPAGMTTCARSPFCQGLALLDPAAVPQWHSKAAPFVARFRDLCASLEVTPVEACLRFALESRFDYVVFGVDSLAQFEENVAISQRAPASGWPALKLALSLPEWTQIPEPIMLSSLWAPPAVTA